MMIMFSINVCGGAECKIGAKISGGAFLEVVMRWVEVLLARETQLQLIEARCCCLIDRLSCDKIRGCCGSGGWCGEAREQSQHSYRGVGSGL